MKTLAEALGVGPGPSSVDAADVAVAATSAVATDLVGVTGSKAFAQAVLDSLEFRIYIVEALRYGSLPSAVITRLMDYAWGKPAERIEHTGKDGEPIATVTEVRRVVIRRTLAEDPEVEAEPTKHQDRVTTH